MSGSELAVIDGKTGEVVPQANAGTLMRQATDVAGVCREIVTRTAQDIQGRKYVRVEGWQSIAVAYGCVASARDVEKVPGGIRAIGEVRRMSDGHVLATAEGFVGEDEATWFGGPGPYGKVLPKRPEYAIRAMAQTRAVSRACRSAFAFVVTLIDGKLMTTPAEEMDGIVDAVAVPSQGTAERTEALKQRLAAAPVASVSPPSRPAAPTSGVFPPYGRAKGAPISGASMKDLEFYADGCRKSLADPAKSRWHAKEQALLDAIQAEIARQSGVSFEGPQEPPPHTDADAVEPF